MNRFRLRLRTFNKTTRTPVYDEFEMVVICAGILLFLVTILMVRTFSLQPGEVLAGIDIHHAFLGWYEFVRRALAEGYLPLWDPYQANGYPFLHNPQVAFFYPPTWLIILLPGHIGFAVFIALHLWLGGMGMLLYVRTMDGNWPGSVLAAIAFALSHSFVIRVAAGHIGVIATYIWFPWLLWLTVWSVRRGTVRSALWTGLIWALSVLAGHTTSLLYTNLGWFCFLVYLVLTRRQGWLILRQTMVVVAVGLAFSAAQWLPTLEFALLSTRAFQPSATFALTYSLPFERLVTLFSPDFLGNPLGRMGYAGPDYYWELTYYAGMLPLVALVLSWRGRNPLTLFYWGLIGLAILLAIGENGFLYELFYRWLPPFRLGRGPARVMFLAIFALCAVLGQVISQWDRVAWEQRVKAVRRFVPLSFVVGLGLMVGGLLFLVGQQRQMGQVTEAWEKHYGFYGGLMVALFAAAMLLLSLYWQTRPDQLRRRYNLAFLLILFVTLESFAFGFRFLSHGPVGSDVVWDEIQAGIGETRQRVLVWDIQNYNENQATKARLASVTAYNPLQLGTYTPLLAQAKSPEVKIYDFLGVRYVATAHPLPENGGLHLIKQSGTVLIYERPSGLPVARLVSEVQILSDELALTRMGQPDFDPTRVVILTEATDCPVADSGDDLAGTAQIMAHRPGYWQIETRSNASSLLVISETAYPGWRVWVDGREVPWYTAYTVVRAVCVPAGQHQVEWVFAPWTVMVGMGISGAMVLMAVGVLGRSAWKKWR
jgi:hypothetical protein